MRDKRIALAGNPNAGKTTLFNRLTGARETVGNRPGVTVEIRERRLRGGGARLYDLPGAYSLDACSEDEAIALAHLRAAQPDLILNVVDATKLERNLYLTTQLLELGLPVVVALNLMDEAEKLGIRVDHGRLSALLGVPVLPVSARTGMGLGALCAACLAPQPVPQPWPAVSPEARYRRVASIVAQAVTGARRGERDAYRADRRIAGSWVGILLFLAVMALVFYLTFDSLGAWLSDGVEILLGWLLQGARAGLARLSAPAWLGSLVCEGVLTGVGGVLAFLPQIALLFFFLSLLEDSGYMARTAFLTDRWLRKLGLSGRAFIPMLMGFGCTVPAALAARTLGSRRERRATILLLPFMSCSAKLPVYALFTAAFFPVHRGLVMLCLYMAGIGGALLTARLLSGTRRAGGETGFVIELPPYRLPRLKNTLLFTGERIRHFTVRAGTVILLMSMLLWLLLNFDFSLRMTGDPRLGMLCTLGGRMAPLLRPVGFGSWQAAVALLTGLVAKEAVVSTLLLLAGGAPLSTLFAPAGALAFLVFVLLYSPCAAALATMRKELGGWGPALLAALYQTVLAYAAAALVYFVYTCLFL